MLITSSYRFAKLSVSSPIDRIRSCEILRTALSLFQKCLIWLCKQALPVSLHFRHKLLPDLPDLGRVDLLLL